MATADRRSDLSDRALFQQTDRLRHKYESLLEDLSGPIGDSDLANVSFNSTDSCAGVELQQWEQMWSHVISMISEVLPIEGSPLRSGTEKRLSLISLISELVRLAKRRKAPRPRAAEAPRPAAARAEAPVRDSEREQRARIAGRLRDVESRIARHLDEQHRLVGRLNGPGADLLRIVRIREESPAHTPAPRKGHREKSQIRELIRTTNLMQQDYRRMAGRKAVSVETVSSLSDG
jgi:hypothetical protein